jgi:hypothetical protein
MTSSPLPRRYSAACTLIISFASFALLTSALSADDRSNQIDKLVEDGYRVNKIQPNQAASDAVFMRRAYLDMIGRIPTKQESEAFLSAEGRGKRAKLIDHLLASEGFASHTFNYWADILRLKTDMKGSAGYAYAEWVKGAVRENKPYDQFVTELITAENSVWENGAVGFYLRDEDMPLDHMAYTTQVFLGTRMVCAQCHDHPFDKWTQKDFYQMAAYTYGVSTSVRPESFEKVDDRLKRMKRRRSYRGLDQYVRKAMNDLLEPLSYGARDSKDKRLKFPKDYQYRDAKPGDEVRASTPFGAKLSLRKGREGLAEWMTSPSNPRFATVIANRLWKRALGVGLIEPVDDFKEDTEANNKRLMEYLSRLITSVRFDQKEFLKVVYNTRTYQREATTKDVDIGKYHFPGPVLRRMSGEQIWDSMMTLSVPAIDERKGSNKYSERLTDMRKRAETIGKKKPQEIVDIAIRMGEIDRDFEEEVEPIREGILEARANSNKTRRKELSAQLKEKEKERDAALGDLKQQLESSGMMFTSMSMMKRDDDKEMEKPKTSDRWKDYSSKFVRASELPSPAPRNHFLAQFGQSEREVIDAAEREASVAQVLTLLNSDLVEQLTTDKSVIMQNAAAAATPEAKGEAIFMTMLNRLPNDRERGLIAAQFSKADKPDKAVRTIIWALLNGREFSFVQ